MSLKVGLVGLGAMGRNHARIVSQSPRVKELIVYDVNSVVSDKAARDFDATSAKTLESLESCDAIVIATATDAHQSIAEKFILMGKPVLIEKPVCSTYEDTQALLTQSLSRGSILMCGFVERFNPALNTGINLIEGPIRHLFTYRHSPYNPRASSHVITDLLIHDLDLTARLFSGASEPQIQASAWKPQNHAFVENVDCLLKFSDEMTAVQSASRWGQRKIRDIRMCTDELLIEIDLLRVTVTTYKYRSQGSGAVDPASYRSETLIEVPFVRHSGEPLSEQFDHFLNLIAGYKDPEQEIKSIDSAHKWSAEIERAVGIGLSKTKYNS